MPGKKTHEQQLRSLERKDDVPKPGDTAAMPNQSGQAEPKPQHPKARQSEMPVSRGGMNQESRQHNKHNK